MRIGPAALLVVCLTLFPARSEAAPILVDIRTLGPGLTAFSGEFEFDNDVFLLPFSVATTALFSVDLTSPLAGGFDAYLTLFSGGTDFQGAFDFMADADMGLPATLGTGNYLLALTQYNNYYTPGAGFDYDVNADMDLAAAAAARSFTSLVFPNEGCDSFAAYDGSCRTSAFAGTLSVLEAAPAPVPEPTTLVLVALGGAGLIARRRKRSADL